MSDNVVVKDVELFRAGKYPQGEIGEDFIDQLISNFEEVKTDVPVTIDHKQTGPAYGWVTRIWRQGKMLLGDLSLVKGFADVVEASLFKNRSIEIKMGLKRLRAVTFLGAQTPQIKGLADLGFADGEEFDSFDFSEADPETPQRRETDPETQTFAHIPVKRERGIDFPARAFLFTPDLSDPATWKLRVWQDLEKKVTRKQIGLAAAAFSPGGFRGRRVQLPANQVRTIKRRLRALYGTLGVPEGQVPAQLKTFAAISKITRGIDVSDVEFFEEHFALVPDPEKPQDWALCLYSDPNGDPDPKLVGQAISYFSPGGFGDAHNTIKPQTPGYVNAKSEILFACEQIDKDPSWAAWKDSDIFHDESMTATTLGDARPDLITSFAEAILTKEDIKMSDENKEKDEQIQGLKTQFSDLETEKKDVETKLEEITAQFAEVNGQMDAIKEKEAKAAQLEDLKTRIANAKFSEKVATHLLEQFSDAENLDGLDAGIEAMKALVASFDEAAGEHPRTDSPTGETSAGADDLDGRATAYSEEHKVDYRTALIEVSKAAK